MKILGNKLSKLQLLNSEVLRSKRAAQTQMKADQERLLKEQKEAKEKRQKENEKARKKEERLKAIPNPPAMTKATDLIEYFALFETTQTRKERDQEEWSIHLLPLLNDKLRVGAMNLSLDERDNYQTLKAKLIESEEKNLKNSAQSFWTLPKEKGMSIRDYGNKLYRLLKRFAGDPDPLQKVLREWIIQTLPKDARAFVRNRDPETCTVNKACCIAEQYFSNEELDLTAWDSKSNDGNRHSGRHYSREKSNNQFQYNKWQPSSRKPLDQDSKPPSSPKNSQESTPQQKYSGGQKWGGGRDRRGDRPRDPRDSRDSKEKGSKEKTTCQICKGAGHIAPDCPTRCLTLVDHCHPPYLCVQVL